MKKLEAVIFDMDGVIADSEYLNVKAKHIQLQMAGVNVEWHYHDKFLGTTHEFMWTEMKKEFGLKEEVPYYIDQWVEVRKKLVEEEGLKPMPGVVDLIHGLKENGFKLAVASSSLKEDIMKNMDLFGITDYFDAFISGSECENGKPDPEVYVAEGGWKARQGGNGLEYAKTSVLTFEPCALQENTINFELQKPIDEGLYELFKPFI